MSSLIRVDYSINPIPKLFESLIEKGERRIEHTPRRVEIIDPNRIKIVNLRPKTLGPHNSCCWGLFQKNYPDIQFLDMFALETFKKVGFPMVFDRTWEVSFPGTILYWSLEENFWEDGSAAYFHGEGVPTVCASSNYQEMWNHLVPSGRDVAIYVP